MVHYSVLIPQRDSAGACGRLLPQLCQVLDSLLLSYEILCIDDASAPPAASDLAALLDEFAPLRLLRFDRPRGTSAALCAGLAAARGELIIALDVRTRAAAPNIPQLIARLSQHDLVCARRERSLGVELGERLASVPRWIAADPSLHASEDLFWAARREAVCGLALARGAFRVLPTLVARRGFRVCHLTLAAGLPPQGTTFRPSLVQRLAARWLDRRFEPHLASELSRQGATQPRLMVTRVDRAGSRVVPQTALLPVEQERRDSA
jgi:glycosyltransferase involved in cell wall biosynthesis